jgi:integrase
MPSDLFAELTDPSNLKLTKDQTANFYYLEKILAESSATVAEALRLGDGDTWTQSDMRALEHELLKDVPGSKELYCVFTALTKIVARYQALYPKIDFPFPRSIHRVRLENNPFHPDLAVSEHLIERLSAAVTEAACTWQKDGFTRNTDPESVKRAVILGVLSSILDFQLLHRSMLIALIEALADREKSLLTGADGNSYAWSLSLAWQGVEDAEGRLFIPRDPTGILLAWPSEKSIRHIFAEGLNKDNVLAVRHKAIYAVLDKAVHEILRNAQSDEKVTLKSILSAAGRVAYLRMPAALAAVRCRKTVSHAPRNEVLRRIFNDDPVRREPKYLAENARPESGIKSVEKEVSDTTEVEPIWLEAMRDAFKLPSRSKVISALQCIRDQLSQPGSCIAGFSLSLLAKNRSVGSTKRYSLLIARRCGCRLKDIDPTSLTIEDLEDYYRKALDDDWDQDPAGVQAQTFQRNKRATIGAIVMFHKYLVEHAGVGPLDELAYLQKPFGLLHVDANFITVDEYFRVLEYISDPVRPVDDYLRRVLRLIVILAFRCGLRRSEVFYLMANDFDDADYLHVRNNSLRRVKTSNAARSIPVGVLLSEDELTELNEFLAERRELYHEGLILFGKKGEVDVSLDPDSLIDKIHTAMREELKDKSLKLHHLRHSFATLMTVKLMPNGTDFVRRFVGARGDKTLEWLMEVRDGKSFRERLFGTSEIRSLDLQAVAHLLGHGSPATSVEHYIHSLDWFEPIKVADVTTRRVRIN